MNPIPSVEERQDLSCVGCFAERPPISRYSIRDNQHPAMTNLWWCIVYNESLEKCRPKHEQCPYRFTSEQHREILDQHNAGEHRNGVVLVCPICGREQVVDLQTYATYELMKGHPYTCGSETCPSHTVMQVKLDAIGKIVMQQSRQEGQLS